MCLTGAVFRSALVVLLLAISCGKRTCDYKKILDSYRGIIVVDLQNLNLTGESTHHKEKDPCPSPTAHRILVSIYRMAQQVRCQRGRKQPSDLEKPVERMEELISYNCNSDQMRKKVFCSTVRGKKKRTRKRRKRTRLIKAINALIVCWQKFQSVYML